MVTQCVFACNSLATILTIFAFNMVKFVTAVLTKQTILNKIEMQGTVMAGLNKRSYAQHIL